MTATTVPILEDFKINLFKEEKIRVFWNFFEYFLNMCFYLLTNINFSELCTKGVPCWNSQRLIPVPGCVLRRDMGSVSAGCGGGEGGGGKGSAGAGI